MPSVRKYLKACCLLFVHFFGTNAFKVASSNPSLTVKSCAYIEFLAEIIS